MRPQPKSIQNCLRRVVLLVALIGAIAGLGLQSSAVAETGERRVLTLESSNGSGIAGEARLTGFGNQTVISIMLSDGSDEVYFPHLHEGTCDDYDGIPIVPLAETTHGKRTRATVDLTLDELLSGRYLIDAHPSMGSAESLFDPDSAVVCGEIPQANLVDDNEAASSDQQADQQAEEPEQVNPDETSSDETLSQFPDAGIGPFGGDGLLGSTLMQSLTLVAVAFGALGVHQRRRLAPTVAQLRLQALMLRGMRPE